MHIVASAGVVVACAVAPALAGGATFVAGSPAEFQQAVQNLDGSGGTIALAARRYPTLAVRGARRGWLTIVAPRGASAGRVVVENTSRVRIVRLRVSPEGAHARLEIRNAHSIVLNGVALTGRGTLRANGLLDASSDVRIEGSTFSRCGEGMTPDAGYCLLLRDTRSVAISGSSFHDCFGCDFVHGAGNHGLAITTSSFHRARVGRCGTSIQRCPHMDLLHLIAGGGVVIDRNVFGLNQWPGAAQIYVNGPMRGLRVTNNLFLPSDPAIPGARVHTSLWIGNRVDADPPRDVYVAHNTILGGAKRTLRNESRPLESTVFFPNGYARTPVEHRPVVANNVIRLQRTPARTCPFLRAFRGNVVIDGVACAPGNAVGDPHLDAGGRPTAPSALLIGQAADEFATRVDLAGRPRVDPDVGAFEHPAP